MGGIVAGVVALVLIATGAVVVWRLVGDREPAGTPQGAVTAGGNATASADAGSPGAPSATAGGALPGEVRCTWISVPAADRPSTTVDVGTPPTSVPAAGRRTFSADTSFGVITATIDVAKVPCTTASLAYLADRRFYDGTKCHRMFDGMLQCGDPSAKGAGYRETDGTGGPAYRFMSENLPVGAAVPYPEGTLAMANAGSPDSNGSQFFFLYKTIELPPDYTVIGTITPAGLDVLRAATQAGHDGAYDPGPGGGRPRSDITIRTLTVR